MKNLVQIYDSYTTFSGIKVPIKINWSAIGAVSIDEAQEFCWQLQDKIKQAREMEKEEYVSDSECMEKLKEYSKEIGLKKPMTLSDLIESHKRLRQNNSDNLKQQNLEIEKVRQEYKKITNYNEFISIETLKKMNLEELYDLLYYNLFPKWKDESIKFT